MDEDFDMTMPFNFLIELNGLQKKEYAAKSGFSAPYVTQISKGTRRKQNKGFGGLPRICKGFNITISDFLLIEKAFRSDNPEEYISSNCNRFDGNEDFVKKVLRNINGFKNAQQSNAYWYVR